MTTDGGESELKRLLSKSITGLLCWSKMHLNSCQFTRSVNQRGRGADEEGGDKQDDERMSGMWSEERGRDREVDREKEEGWDEITRSMTER